MNNRILVAPPANMCSDDANLFKPFLKYKSPSLKVKYIKNPFITNSGLVCGRKGLLKESYHYTMPDEPYERLNEVSHYYHAANDDASKLIVLDDDNMYLLIHHTWHNNYYHWICETILRLWMVKNDTKKMILLLPSEYQLSSFVTQSLAPFNFQGIFYIPAEKSVLVRNLCMPQLKPVMASYIPDALIELNNIYVNYIKTIKIININLGERLYVSRQKSRRRKIGNEDDVIAVLKQYSFNTIYNEDYSFLEQVSIYSNAKYLTSIHGAGLTNMLFMPERSTVFEFHKQQTNNTDQHSLIFWYMANGLNHSYYQQMCKPTNIEEDFFKADLIVDITLLKQNMKIMFG
ncbi:MAG: glycosyltransferase family 61 protein [Mucilaginibacter sp.]